MMNTATAPACIPVDASGAQQGKQHPEAFIDGIGFLRDWNTANILAPDWTGIAKTSKDTFIHFSMEGAHRRIVVLQATDYQMAIAEARKVEALLVPVEDVLNAQDQHSFAHFTANQEDPQGLLKEMQSHALTTVHDVTGADPGQFFERAVLRLSKVFGIAHYSQEYCNAYFERKGLAQVFAQEAERLVNALGV